MRKFFLFLFASSLLAHPSLAQEAGTDKEESSVPAEKTSTNSQKSVESWGVSLSSLQWNETLRVQQGIKSAKDVANYNGLIVALQKEVTYYRWGWSAVGFLGSGRANGGGNSPVVTYEKSKVAFTVYGVAPRVFYRLSGRINTGVTGMVFIKNIDWPKDAANQNIDSGRNLNVMPLMDLNIRLFQKWDFYTGIGPLSEGANTLWKIGVNYRF